ncbi:alpha/beta fold hydrolase [Ectothiorhodospiraceae bacterium WFHF3C12]|nr:alpha/beta fold hydrolase [Ectothiorhodospiraceae bacterium WFHF3C12]
MDTELTAWSGESATRRSVDDAPPPFRPAWWLRSGHLQTLWPAVAEPAPAVPLRVQRLDLPDGDFLDLFHGPAAAGPVVLLLHGLAGCARSGYMLHAAEALTRHGYQAVAMQYRGAGGEINRLPRFYHSGAIDDVGNALASVRRCYPGRPVALVGFSLGGILTLNYAGHHGDRALCEAAVSISAPLDLDAAARAVDEGFARLYQWDILRGLKAMIRRKFPMGVPRGPSPPAVERIRSIRAFDEQITAPLHGFRDAADYYRQWSPGRHLPGISLPLLFLAARDDPFLPAPALAGTHTAPANALVKLPDHGGHVGFIAGGRPRAAEHWLPERIVAFMNALVRDRAPLEAPTKT